MVFHKKHKAETLAVLDGKLEDVHLSAFQPCGKAWQAAITCTLTSHVMWCGYHVVWSWRNFPVVGCVLKKLLKTPEVGNVKKCKNSSLNLFSHREKTPKAFVWTNVSRALQLTMIVMWRWPWRARCSSAGCGGTCECPREIRMSLNSGPQPGINGGSPWESPGAAGPNVLMVWFCKMNNIIGWIVGYIISLNVMFACFLLSLSCFSFLVPESPRHELCAGCGKKLWWLPKLNKMDQTLLPAWRSKSVKKPEVPTSRYCTV